ncbi:hypothetical protein SUGI_0613510 [Cryptomeria japonica]|nr:hypothetical protein SUGI_0613510 [Cryptomeria japonica]
MEEEAQKRYTDCVYFLASPLTCKKGIECEYRHSENARINPRHCWYWLNGNCLNPHCAFRHPPLEVHSPGSVNESSPASGNTSKTRVPCYFFFQGYCVKGDKCSYMHGTPFGGNSGVSASQKTTKVNGTGTEPQSVEKKDTNGSDNATAKLAPVRSTTTEGQLPTEPKCISEVGPPLYNENTDQHTPELSLPDLEYPLESLPEDPPVNDINFGTRSEIHQDQPTDDWLENDMESDEWLEESSPGFDVLVDDGPEQLGYQDDGDYLSNFDMEPGREPFLLRERLIPATDELAQFDYEGMHEELGYFEGGSQFAHMTYDQCEELAHERSYGHVNQHKRKSFEDRDLDVAVLSERRGLPIEKYSCRIEKADLRHRLGKYRRADRTQIGCKFPRRSHSGGRAADFHHGCRQQGNEQIYPDTVAVRHQGSRSKNVRTRFRMLSAIDSFPRESFNNTEPDFEQSPENFLSRSSVARQGSIEHFRGGHKEKDRGRIHVGAGAQLESSGFRKHATKIDLGKNDTDFARPKTLEQIKEAKRKAALLNNGPKICDANDERQNSEQSAVCGSQFVALKSQVGNNLPGEERKINLGKVIVNESIKLQSFEGPKPLSALLKAKQKSSDSPAGKLLSKGKGEFSQKSELNGNSKTSEIGGKSTVLSLHSQKEEEEGGFEQGRKETCAPISDVLENKSSCLSTKFELGNSPFQSSGVPVITENDRRENLSSQMEMILILRTTRMMILLNSLAAFLPKKFAELRDVASVYQSK